MGQLKCFLAMTALKAILKFGFVVVVLAASFTLPLAFFLVANIDANIATIASIAHKISTNDVTL